MAFANRSTPRLRHFRASILPIFLWIAVIIFVPAILSRSLFAQNSNSSSTSGALPPQTSSIPTSQVQTSAQNSVFGSVPEAKLTPGVLPLTFSDAIERALRQNLAGLLSQYNTIEARGEKWEQLSELLPHVNGDVTEVRQKVSLQALGFTGALFPGVHVPAVIGPFSYFDVRASATQRVFDWKSIQKYRSSVIGESVARFNLKDARDLVVLATGNAYLLAI